jgi:ABC-type polysaccharide/polyol phosphate transport system ATPase subunit
MPAITLDHVFVDLPIYNSRGRSLKSRILSQTVGGRVADDRDRSVVVIRALNDVCVSLEHGSRVALIGHNGAGKSTLLRVIAGIYPPTSGRVVTQGNIACLTDISVGMDLEGTGYENIIIRGVLMGLSKSEAAALIPQVEEFTGLGEYLGLPTRTYSQGMLLRLAFGISTAFQPDIILLDEIIGVGDQSFADRARLRLDKLIQNASILVIASHMPEIVTSMCTTAVWLDHGRVMGCGPPTEMLQRYVESASVKEEMG